MLLALFLIDTAAGLVLFLPLVGRRNAGVKFYRMTLVIGAALALGAALAHGFAGRRSAVAADASVVALSVALLLVLRFPRRLIYRGTFLLLGAAYLIAAAHAWDIALRPPHFFWSVAGAVSSIGLLGSVVLAMTLGHWYLVVRGMPIEPLKRLTLATLVAVLVKIAVVAAALVATWPAPAARDIFFWMRAGWGLLGPIALFPMVWGTVRIRSTMAATGILYVDVVAVIIGEVLGTWLSAGAHVPL